MARTSPTMMASSKKTALVLALLCFLVLQELEIHSHRGLATAEVLTTRCRVKCKHRCRRASRHRMCIRACRICCHRCNCVPPGTSGKTAGCPCYALLTTHGGQLKCP